MPRAYAFGRPAGEADPHRVGAARPDCTGDVKPMPQWTALIRDHNPGYISWEQFERNQRRLEENADREAPVEMAADGPNQSRTQQPDIGTWSERMPFITYAQNFEDLMLYRALRHVDKGLYIDLGASDPDFQSVTRAFYERGWRGINVEPNPSFFSRLAERRNEDVNINVAVSDATGEAEFFFVGENTWLSTLERDMAHRYEDQGMSVRTEGVRIVTLRDICEQHVGDKAIHFLKIDVEGHELGVLRGGDFTRWRPWIIVAEAHDEHDSWDAWKAWQELLERSDYRFIYQDGLNRYLHSRRNATMTLAKAFRVPPNCYDNWQLAETTYFEQRAAAAEARAKELEQRAAAAEARAKELEQQVEILG